MLLKGLRKNDGEFGLILMIYSLRRIFNILGADRVKAGKKMCVFQFFVLSQSIPCIRIKSMKDLLRLLECAVVCNRDFQRSYYTNCRCRQLTLGK
jgi:hypothetical protein